METAAHYVGAGIGGGVGGLLFAAIWRRMAPLSTHGRYWRAMREITRGMLDAEEARDFLRLYALLGRSLAGYLGRNLGGLALACLPAIALAYALNLLLFAPWDAAAGAYAVHPAAAARLEVSEGRGLLLLPGRSAPIALEGDPARAAACWSGARCLLLQSLAFSVTRLDRPPLDRPGWIVVRADRKAWNPLFPYLNDLEFVFFAATVAGVGTGMLPVRRSRR